MVATVLIREWNGTTAAPTQTNKQGGTVRFKNANNSSVDTAARLIIPTANREYSFAKWLQLNISVAPSVDIDNLQAYTDGAKGWQTGVKGWYMVRSTFELPAVPTETNDPPTQYTTQYADLFTATSAARINMDAGLSGPYTTTGDIGDWLVLVMEVEIGSTQGTEPAETLTFSYDET